MHDWMILELRDFARVQPKDGLEIEARTDGGLALTGEVLDLSMSGAGARFPADKNSVVPVGELTHLRLTSSRMEEPIETHATIVHRVDVGDVRHYGFHFEWGRADPARPGEDEPVRALLEVKVKGADPFRAQVRVFDISTTGIGLLVGPRVEAALAGAERAMVSLRLPGTDRDLRLSAWIRNRRLTEQEVCYGLEFDSRHCKEFKKQQAVILDYVMRRHHQACGGTGDPVPEDLPVAAEVVEPMASAPRGRLLVWLLLAFAFLLHSVLCDWSLGHGPSQFFHLFGLRLGVDAGATGTFGPGSGYLVALILGVLAPVALLGLACWASGSRPPSDPRETARRFLAFLRNPSLAPFRRLGSRLRGGLEEWQRRFERDVRS